MSGKGSRLRPVDQEVYGKEWERIFAARPPADASVVLTAAEAGAHIREMLWRRDARRLMTSMAEYCPNPDPYE